MYTRLMLCRVLFLFNIGQFTHIVQEYITITEKYYPINPMCPINQRYGQKGKPKTPGANVARYTLSKAKKSRTRYDTMLWTAREIS